MSTTRRESAAQTRRRLGVTRENRLCSCGCGRRCEPPRQSWHSQACVDNWMLVNDPATARRKVFARDQGVCAGCGVDTEALRSRRRVEIQYWNWLARKHVVIEMKARKYPSWGDASNAVMKMMREHYLADGWPDPAETWWNADHIVEVVRGGGQCGLENLQTLCLLCHKAKTKQLAADRAEERRRAKVTEDPQMPLFGEVKP